MVKKKETKNNLIIFTIGHSTRTIDDFISLLQQYGIKKLIDIRTIARSRHNPQFNEDELKDSLKKVHIGYRHMKELGGLRHAHADSINMGWHNASFRGYADYMQTEEFKEGIEKLIARAEKSPVAIMCAEALPWRCHRSLVADALLVRGITVEDIMSKTSLKPHIMTAWAQVRGKNITYPAAQE